MTIPVAIWIVEDVIEDASEAWDVIEKIVSEDKIPADLSWADSFDWYPKLKNKISESIKGQELKSDAYPDIVVLDLCYRAKNSEELRGDKFYQELRKWEAHKPSGLPALVLLWSLHQGRQDTDRFVHHAIALDSRVIPLASKRKEMLNSTVKNCLARIIEERDS